MHFKFYLQYKSTVSEVNVHHSTREELVQQNRSISKKQRINKTLVHKDATMADSDVANLQLSNSVRDMLQHKWYVRDETGLHAVVVLKRELSLLNSFA
jgi:hypothetical protein